MLLFTWKRILKDPLTDQGTPFPSGKSWTRDAVAKTGSDVLSVIWETLPRNRQASLPLNPGRSNFYCSATSERRCSRESNQWLPSLKSSCWQPRRNRSKAIIKQHSPWSKLFDTSTHFSLISMSLHPCLVPLLKLSHTTVNRINIRFHKSIQDFTDLRLSMTSLQKGRKEKKTH